LPGAVLYDNGRADVLDGPRRLDAPIGHSYNVLR
jgi:hypothetical protein